MQLGGLGSCGLRHPGLAADIGGGPGQGRGTVSREHASGTKQSRDIERCPDAVKPPFS